MSKMITLLCGIITFAIFFAACDYADAARIGGGRSFGSKSFMSRPANPPSTFTQQSTRQQQSAATAAPRSGFGGMLGGLLIGSMLGSMLFGGGPLGSMMGGLMNVIILGGLVYLAFRFLSSLRRARTNQCEDAAFTRQNHGQNNAYQYQTSPPTPGWDTLRGTGSGSGSGAGVSSNRVHIDGDFDTEEFLRGAKAAYTRLNAAWDRRDIQDIAQFSTPNFVQMIREQAAEDPTPSKTEILLVNADLVDVRREGDEQMASVFFNVVMREDPRMSGTSDIREVWHFVRSADGSGSWKLDGIQQVAM